jgi:large subunit ribosomal protein L24
MQKIKTNDNVIVVAGKDKGKTGLVKEVLGTRVVVAGVNMVKKHLRSNPQQPEKTGGIVDREAALHISNVALLNPKTNKADKVGFKVLAKEQRKVRYFKSNGEVIDV